jgi:hypothetical protein
MNWPVVWADRAGVPGTGENVARLAPRTVLGVLACSRSLALVPWGLAIGRGHDPLKET